jgi:DNA-binding response OmpR family regulator
VLVVEDDAATAAFLADNLTADGYRVAVASAAAEGLRAIAVRRPDVVLLDVVLEDGSGLALLDSVRAADGLASRLDRDLPVIVLSGRGSEVERVRGLQRGADDYLVKPTLSLSAAASPSVSRRRIGRQASSTPATTSGRACGTTTQRPTARAIAPLSARKRSLSDS